MIELLEVEHPQSRECTMAVDDVGDPAETADRFEGTTYEEDGALVIVIPQLAVYVKERLALEEVIIVDEVDL